MYRLQLIETLRMEDGHIERRSYHEARYQQAMSNFFPDMRGRRLIDILSSRGLKESNPAYEWPGVWKVHIDYDANTADVKVDVYHPKRVESLRLVECNDIDYSYKYADRSKLSCCLGMRNGCDDVIIVKDGLLTDTSYSNIALYDGKTWFTPRCPLLKGTMRAYLLDKGMLKEEDIRPQDLSAFIRVSLINAMLPLGKLTVEMPSIIR